MITSEFFLENTHFRSRVSDVVREKKLSLLGTKTIGEVKVFWYQVRELTKVEGLIGYRDQKCQGSSLGFGFSEPNSTITTPSLTTSRKVYAVSYITTSPPTPPHIQ